jgi:hypothetical protein
MLKRTKVASLVTLGVLVAVTGFVAIAADTAAPAPEKGWIALFDGKTLTGWVNGRNPSAENRWTVEDGAMTNVAHGNDIATTQTFKDFDLKLEFKTVKEGNSGIYLRGREEIQVFDSFGKTEVGKADCGAIYDQYAPLANPCKAPGEWNTVEASYVGDTITAKLNGVLILDKVKITKPTGGALPGGVGDPGPLLLQGDHGKVWYRNIQIRLIDAPGDKK